MGRRCYRTYDPTVTNYMGAQGSECGAKGHYVIDNNVVRAGSNVTAKTWLIEKSLPSLHFRTADSSNLLNVFIDLCAEALR